MSAKPALLTVGRIATILGIPIHRVRFVLATRSDIEPTAFAGRTRLFDKRALARIRYEVAAMDARRCGNIDELIEEAESSGLNLRTGNYAKQRRGGRTDV